MQRSDHREKRRIWLRRIGLSAAIALFAFEIIYVIAANVILQTHLLDKEVTGSTPGLFLKIGSGWTVLPGRVHAKNVELRFEDYNVQFSIALEEGVVDIALLQLPAKIFHLTRVRATGVTYLFRHKVKSGEGLERRLALYPKIPGYADPPLFVGENEPPLSDEEYNLWTIHVEDVDARVKELWFLEYRFTGTARARGSFRLVPERDAQTELCKLSLDGTLRTGEVTVASKLQGWLYAKLDRHDPRLPENEGAKIFNKISINTKLDAFLPNLEFTELYRSKDGLQLSGGTGPVHVRAQLEHGAWMDNTAARYETEAITIAKKPVGVSGPVVLSARIVKGGRDSTVELSATTPRLRLLADGAPKEVDAPLARSVRLALGASADITRPSEVRSMKAQLKLDVPDLRWLDVALEEDKMFTHGNADADVDLRWTKGELGGGKLAVDAKEARFALAGNVLQVSGEVDAQLSYDGETKRGQVNKLEVDLPQVAVSHEQDWKALPQGLRARSERLTWQGEPPRAVQGRFTLDAKEIDPFLPFVISSSILRTIADALVDLGETHAVVELNRTPSALELRLEEARSGDLTVYGILRSEKGTKDSCGRFYVHDPKFGVGIELHRGETSIKPLVTPEWWRERHSTTTCGPEFDGPERRANAAEQAEPPKPATASRPTTALKPAKSPKPAKPPERARTLLSSPRVGSHPK